MTDPSRPTNTDSTENGGPPQLPRFVDGDIVTASDMNRIVDAVNYLLRSQATEE